MFSLTPAAENMGRLYINPFNGNALDLWILVQEDAGFLNSLRHSQVRSAIGSIVDEFIPLGSGARFSIGFYGASNQTRWAVPPGTSNGTSVKSLLSRFQFLGRNSSVNYASVQALKDVIAACNSTTCRNNVPRVLLMIGNKFNETLEECNYTLTTTAITTTIAGMTTPEPPTTTAQPCNNWTRTISHTLRELEKENLFTVVIAGVGFSEGSFVGLASEPHETFGIALSAVGELSSYGPYLADVIGEVPRFVEQDTRLSFSNAQVNQDNVMMINVGDATKNGNGMVALTLRCRKCNVFASTSFPRPTLETGSTLRATHNVTGLADTSMYYVRLGNQVQRLYINVEILTIGTTEAWVSVFPLPNEPSAVTYKRIKRSYFHE